MNSKSFMIVIDKDVKDFAYKIYEENYIYMSFSKFFSMLINAMSKYLDEYVDYNEFLKFKNANFVKLSYRYYFNADDIILKFYEKHKEVKKRYILSYYLEKILMEVKNGNVKFL